MIHLNNDDIIININTVEPPYLKKFPVQNFGFVPFQIAFLLLKSVFYKKCLFTHTLFYQKIVEHHGKKDVGKNFRLFWKIMTYCICNL